MSAPQVRALACSLICLLTFTVTAADLSYSNKWRIECSGNAESTGTVELRITPRKGEPISVTVQIEDGRSENGVARDIRDALRSQLPAGAYDVETDDGEDVLIKKNFNEPTFAIEVVTSTVDDVRIRLDRE